jgi:protein-S-isoprenylcysteine O-methyltransferase Ste14
MKHKDNKINKEANMVSSFFVQFNNCVLISLLCIVNYCFDTNSINHFDTLLLFLAIAGAIIRYKAYYDLGCHFTFDIGIIKGHKLVTQGIYKYIAHPGYFGSLLVMISCIIFTLKSVNYFVLASLICNVLYLCYDRIKKEERILLEYFSIEYKNYLMITKRLIPFVY